MSSFHPNKPAWKATATEIRRVAIISQQELASSAGFATIDPQTLTELKVWLDVSQATSDVDGVSSIPDVLGGSPAVQAVNAQKPVLGATGNGFAKLTTAAAKGMTLPLSAGISDTAYFGMAMWIRPTNTAANGNLMSILRTAVNGTASADRMEIRQNTNDIRWYVYQPGAIRGLGSNTARGFFFQNLWRFVMFEYNGAAATEAERAVLKDMAMPLASPMGPVFTDESGTSTMPAALTTVTGDLLLFNRNTLYTGGFQGDIGPDIYFYDPRTMTDAKRIGLANYRVPTQ